MPGPVQTRSLSLRFHPRSQTSGSFSEPFKRTLVTVSQVTCHGISDTVTLVTVSLVTVCHGIQLARARPGRPGPSGLGFVREKLSRCRLRIWPGVDSLARRRPARAASASESEPRSHQGSRAGLLTLGQWHTAGVTVLVTRLDLSLCSTVARSRTHLHGDTRTTHTCTYMHICTFERTRITHPVARLRACTVTQSHEHWYRRGRASYARTVA